MTVGHKKNKPLMGEGSHTMEFIAWLGEVAFKIGSMGITNKMIIISVLMALMIVLGTAAIHGEVKRRRENRRNKEGAVEPLVEFIKENRLSEEFIRMVAEAVAERIDPKDLAIVMGTNETALQTIAKALATNERTSALIEKNIRERVTKKALKELSASAVAKAAVLEAVREMTGHVDNVIGQLKLAISSDLIKTRRAADEVALDLEKKILKMIQELEERMDEFVAMVGKLEEKIAISPVSPFPSSPGIEKLIGGMKEPDNEREKETLSQGAINESIGQTTPCPACGVDTKPSDTFCGECGHELITAEVGTIEVVAHNSVIEPPSPVKVETETGEKDAGAIVSPESRTCSVCGAPIGPKDEFCPNCGCEPELTDKTNDRAKQTELAIDAPPIGPPEEWQVKESADDPDIESDVDIEELFELDEEVEEEPKKPEEILSPGEVHLDQDEINTLLAGVQDPTETLEPEEKSEQGLTPGKEEKGDGPDDTTLSQGEMEGLLAGVEEPTGDPGGIDSESDVNIEELLELDEEVEPAEVVEEPKPVSPPKVEKESLSEIFERRQIKYMLGKKVLKDIYDDSGDIIIAKDDVVTDDIVQKAKSARKFLELSMNIVND